MNWKPEELLDDFLIAARNGKIEIPPNVICNADFEKYASFSSVCVDKEAIYRFAA